MIKNYSLKHEVILIRLLSSESLRAQQTFQSHNAFEAPAVLPAVKIQGEVRKQRRLRTHTNDTHNVRTMHQKFTRNSAITFISQVRRIIFWSFFFFFFYPRSPHPKASEEGEEEQEATAGGTGRGSEAARPGRAHAAAHCQRTHRCAPTKPSHCNSPNTHTHTFILPS